MIQLVEPNLNTVGTSGWCLAYAQNMFGAPAIEPNAWSAWLNTQYKHAEGLPNVAVPCWFDGADGEGHVVVYVPSQGFYSSPYNTSTTHAVLSSIAEVERIYGVGYVGWSEDIETLRVAKENKVASQDQVDKTTVQLEYNNGLLRDATEGEITDWVNNPRTVESLQRTIQASAEHIQVLKDQQLGVKARTENWGPPSSAKTLTKGEYKVL